MSTIAVNTITDASGGNTAQINGATPTAYNTMGRNRIINGDMRIDQRNAGASVSTASVNPYTVDRWQAVSNPASKFTAQQNAGSVTTPAGFTNYLGITSTSAYSSAAGDQIYILHNFEGYTTADLGFGTANAKTVTISFWVRSSLTGTFGGSLRNYGSTRSYPYTYTISAANTWEYKTITIPGDTSGTWVGASNAGSMILFFNLGSGSNYQGTPGAWASADYRSATGATSVVGTNGATWYITGVQLEVGSVATEFERRPYGTELSLCQRYFQVSKDVYGFVLSCFNTVDAYGQILLTPSMRAAPTVALTNSGNAFYAGGSARTISSLNVQTPHINGFQLKLTGSGFVSGQAGHYDAPNFYTASAEL